jgi:hypothetical protein
MREASCGSMPAIHILFINYLLIIIYLSSSAWQRQHA